MSNVSGQRRFTSLWCSICSSSKPQMLALNAYGGCLPAAKRTCCSGPRALVQEDETHGSFNLEVEPSHHIQILCLPPDAPEGRLASLKLVLEQAGVCCSLPK